jgi:hypothetical protein
VPTAVAEPAAERLVDAGLIETVGMDRYRVPELVGLFAREYAGGAVCNPAQVTATGGVCFPDPHVAPYRS